MISEIMFCDPFHQRNFDSSVEFRILTIQVCFMKIAFHKFQKSERRIVILATKYNNFDPGQWEMLCNEYVSNKSNALRLFLYQVLNAGHGKLLDFMMTEWCDAFMISFRDDAVREGIAQKSSISILGDPLSTEGIPSGAI